MSGFFGGGYPRGNPPDWDDQQDEQQVSADDAEDSTIGRYGVPLLISVILSFLPLGIVFFVLNKLSGRENFLDQFSAAVGIAIILGAWIGAIIISFIILLILTNKISWLWWLKP